MYRTASAALEPLHSLLYRYFFFDWLFKDVSCGSMMERAAAWRSNREKRRYLPIYLRRWLVIFLAGYGLGVLFEKGFELVYAAACCYSSSCISVPVIFVIMFSWLALSRD